MSRVLIAVPSKARQRVLEKCLFSWLSPAYPHLVIFIEPQDEDDYTPMLLRRGANCQFLGLNDGGLGYCKGQIKAFAEKNGFDYIFKMDDDVSGLCGVNRRLDRANSQAILTKAIEDGVAAMEEHEQVAGISYPYRNQMFTVGTMWPKANQRFQSCYLVRTEYFHADPKISVFEDLFNFVHIRTRNKITLAYGLMGINLGVAVGKGTGGHQCFNRLTRAREEAAYIQKLVPWVPFRGVSGKAWTVEPDFRAPAFGGVGFDRARGKRGAK